MTRVLSIVGRARVWVCRTTQIVVPLLSAVLGMYMRHFCVFLGHFLGSSVTHGF